MSSSTFRRVALVGGVGTALLLTAMPSHALPTEHVLIDIKNVGNAGATVTVSSNGDDSLGFYITAVRANQSARVDTNDPQLASAPGGHHAAGKTLSVPQGGGFPSVITVSVTGGKLDAPDRVFDGYQAALICQSATDCTLTPTILSLT